MKAVDAFISHTNAILESKGQQIFSSSFGFDVDLKKESEVIFEDPCLKELYDLYFGTPKYRCDHLLPFTDWLVNGVFPVVLYNICGQDLMKMNTDPRFTSSPIYSKKDGWSSFFGRMCRPRIWVEESGSVKTNPGFLPYMIERMRVPMHRGMPHFYFDVEQPSWVFEPLIENPGLLKTGRTALACVMNLSFKWDNKTQTMHLCMIMRSNQWSHLYGDVFGGRAILIAVLRELGLEKGRVTIFSPSFQMDCVKEARGIVTDMIVEKSRR